MNELEERLRRDIARGADARTIARLLAMLRSSAGGDPEAEAAAVPIMAGDRTIMAARRYLDAVSAAKVRKEGWRRLEIYEEDAVHGPLAPLRTRVGSQSFLLLKAVRTPLGSEEFDAILSTVPSADPMNNIECKVVRADLEEFDGDMSCDLTLDLRPLDGETFDVKTRVGRRRVDLTATAERGPNVVVYSQGVLFNVVVIGGRIFEIEPHDDAEDGDVRATRRAVERAVDSEAFLSALANARARLAARPRRRTLGRRRR